MDAGATDLRPERSLPEKGRESREPNHAALPERSEDGQLVVKRPPETAPMVEVDGRRVVAEHLV